MGFAYQALREACWGEHADRIMIVDYDILVSRPAEVLGLIYDFVGEPRFK
ncbi:MAG: sulfotransferase, partial [Yoonia sp.]